MTQDRENLSLEEKFKFAIEKKKLASGSNSSSRKDHGAKKSGNNKGSQKRIFRRKSGSV